MRTLAIEIAYGTDKRFRKGPINTRGNEYITNGNWLLKESYAPKDLLRLKKEVKTKFKPKKSIVEGILKKAPESHHCLLIGKYVGEYELDCLKYTFHKYIIPKSSIKRRKKRINACVHIQMKYIKYFKENIKAFHIKATGEEEPIFIYSDKELIGAIMPVISKPVQEPEPIPPDVDFDIPF